MIFIKQIFTWWNRSTLGTMILTFFSGKLKGVDIRTMGSGNAGGTNAFRTQGLLFASGVIIIDIESKSNAYSKNLR